ncbi:hypothetical protein [Thomasclavelia cocleata]|jgi:hypothetical protein|uniref:DUF2383 domain-containing protein n=3 Tax=Thomasclavelia cocleata TaxID=69824 RepID=A0A829ZC93_9FIRM|nr:hypothetical protein [Thomasclavelia cocleata]MCI9132413.1 hypothetical protein [Thomasclavelia cocleata]MCI9631468.1 hypothetical protein [Thomasclavelia cocleata]GFI41689.1 hypothetical protein IMSAGC017_01734 [Thomasclavelia cocleata]
MNDDVKLLNFIYQNSQMGVETIDQLEKIVEDKNFKRYLKEKYEGYCKIHKDAKEKLNSHGYDEKGISSFEKLRTYLMINMQTLTDKSTTHIAEMMMIGSTMGIVSAIRNLNDYSNADNDIIKLMETLKAFEEKSYHDLQVFI